jgi:KaiC/GvpD/RAD55 family RecA-like ATPase
METMTADSVPQQNIPKEIVSFFRGETGRTFIVKGKPRCGKTTFALQIAHEIMPSDNIYYIATRGSNQPLYGKYPWLKTHDERIKALMEAKDTAGPAPVQPRPAVQPPPQQQAPPSGEQPQSARALLQSILKDTATSMQPPHVPAQQKPSEAPQQFRLDRGHISVLLQGVEYAELEAVYKGVERAYPTKSLLMINRIDRLASKYGTDMEALVKVLIRDLVLETNTDLLLVLNKIDSGLDHLAEGIITLKEFGGGMVFIGQLEMNKLSGVQIKQDKYLYNLLDGKFKLLKGITHWG